MRAILLLVLLGFLCGGCATGEFARGRGDVGQFIIKRAIAYGATPLVTEGLPPITELWLYSEDANGTGIRMSGEYCEAVEQFFQKAFGTPDIGARQGARFGQYQPVARGGAIQFTCDDRGVQVILLRPNRGKSSR